MFSLVLQNKICLLEPMYYANCIMRGNKLRLRPHDYTRSRRRRSRWAGRGGGGGSGAVAGRVGEVLVPNRNDVGLGRGGEVRAAGRRDGGGGQTALTCTSSSVLSVVTPLTITPSSAAARDIQSHRALA
eukprot:SAG11_NODE_577_length_8382_cov_36.300374_7_plen_129_part_00